MKKPDTHRQLPQGGVLHPSHSAQQYTLQRHSPPDSVEPWIETLWIASWQRSAPHTQQNLPDPCVHLTRDSTGDHTLYGPVRGRFEVQLDAVGWVMGLKFHPGVFGSLWTEPVHSLIGQQLCPPDHMSRVIARWNPDSPVDRLWADVNAWLGMRTPDPAGVGVQRWVEWIHRDPTVARVHQLVTHTGRAERTIQRLFRAHLGPSPKWVIRRARILEAVEALEHSPPSWTDLSYRLGFADQAHFSREFHALTGLTPTQYMEQGTR